MDLSNQKSNQIFSNDTNVFSQPAERMNLPPEAFKPNLPQPKKSHKRLFIFVGVFLGLAILIGGGYFAWSRGYISLPLTNNRIIVNEILTNEEQKKIFENDQKMSDQLDRVNNLCNTLRHYNEIFDEYPDNWSDLRDTTNEEIDQMLATVKATGNIPDWQEPVEESSAEFLKSNLSTIVITDFFTEKEYPYKVTDNGFEFIYQMPLDKMPDIYQSQKKMPVVNGVNTANQLLDSIEFYLMINQKADEDADGDRLVDYREAEYKTNVNNPDTDGDGLSDYDEINGYSSNPLNKDSDEDGYDDKTEVENGYNPFGEDKAHKFQLLYRSYTGTPKISCPDNKFYNYRRDYIYDKNQQNKTDENDYACCDNVKDCVFNGSCYHRCDEFSTDCQLVDLDGDGVAGNYCKSNIYSEWGDCDGGDYTCTNSSFCGYTYAWVGSGGGEFCCGDDAGEELIIKDGEAKCSKMATDTLDVYGILLINQY